MRLINTTPHAIDFAIEGYGRFTLPAGSIRLRLLESQGGVLFKTPQGIPVRGAGSVTKVIMLEDGKEREMPDVRDGVYFVVSLPTGKVLSNRRDVLILGTGPQDNPIRENGRIAAVRCLKFP
tara:strand:- start:3060 stop:3425 length:366 start_codon:yes stop_codon:yes gene_type:complete